MAAVVLHGNLSIDIFNPAATEWKRWLQKFQAAIKIFKVPAEQQVLYLLHYIGSAAFDVICNKMAPADLYTLPFEDLVTSLGEFYAPEPLTERNSGEFPIPSKEIKKRRIREGFCCRLT